MHWGHAVSKDLVHWQEVDEALYPDALGPMFSGSAVVDHANSSGFGKDGQAPLVLIYTAAGNPATQCIAYSLDGRTFTKYEGNPVVKNITGGNRDPKVFWHAPSKRWVMALYVGRPDKRHTVELLASPNLREWVPLSAVPGDRGGGTYLYECPDLFELPVAGGAERRWVLFGADGQYAVGTFDGAAFTPEEERLRGNGGTACYAAQTFSDLPDGRRVLIGWLQAPSPGMPFNQGMTLPQELGLVKTAEGIRLTRAPVRELEALRARTQKVGPADLAAGSANPLAGFEAELVELRLACDVSADAVVAVDLRGVPVRYDAAKQELTVAKHAAPWPVRGGRLGLIIYLDRTCVEVFSQDGLLHAPVAVIPRADARTVSVAVEKGSAKAVRGEAHALRSCWK
jgi:sucrose-6-phosphate hydrolase SacC (GH32 family)